MSWSKPKTYAGRPIKSLADLIRQLKADRWIYWNGRPYHPGIIMNQQFGLLLRVCTQMHVAMDARTRKPYLSAPIDAEMPF